MSRFLEDSALSNSLTYTKLTDYVQNLRPQADLINPDSAFEGLKISSNKIGINGTVGGWYKYTVAYTDFATAATTSADSTVVSLGNGGLVHYVKVNTTTGFTGGGASTCTIDVGTTSGTPTEYVNLGNVFAATTTTPSGTYTGPDFLTENASTPILARIICDVNCNTLTAGAADIWMYVSFADSVL